MPAWLEHAVTHLDRFGSADITELQEDACRIAFRAAPVVAEARPLHTYATIAATSSGVAKRLISEDGRTVWKNSRSTVAASTPRARPSGRHP